MIRPEDISGMAATCLSPGLCSQLLQHGLLLSKNNMISRNLMYNGPVVVGENTMLVRARMDAYSFVASNSSVVTTKIGRYCSVGDYVQFGMGLHDTDCITTSTAFTFRSFFAFHSGKVSYVPEEYFEREGEETSEVTLGHDVWVGSHVCFTKSVTVGSGAVTGAHTVVTRDIPPYAVVIPGNRGYQILRYRFSDEVISDLMELEWWRYDLPKYSAQTGKVIPIKKPQEFIAFMKNEDLTVIPELQDNWRYLEVFSADKVNIHQVDKDFDMTLAVPLMPRAQLLALRQKKAAADT